MVPKICSVPACSREHHGRTYCKYHARLSLAGMPHEAMTEIRGPLNLTLEERFWSKVDKSGDCWEWTASRYNYGHGQFFIGPNRRSRCRPAHRVSYEMANGPIPDSLVIDHICHNPPCVNPAHLRAVTQKENTENRRGAHKSSKSGVRGVWHAPNGKWRARLTHHGEEIRLGSFETLEDAEAAVIAKRNELFTCNDADRRTKN